MFDVITNPLADVWHLIGNVFQFFAVVIVLFIVGLIVAIPIGMKLFAVALAKTIVVETVKVLDGVGNSVQVRNAINTINTQLNRGDE